MLVVVVVVVVNDICRRWEYERDGIKWSRVECDSVMQQQHHHQSNTSSSKRNSSIRNHKGEEEESIKGVTNINSTNDGPAEIRIKSILRGVLPVTTDRISTSSSNCTSLLHGSGRY